MSALPPAQPPGLRPVRSARLRMPRRWRSPSSPRLGRLFATLPLAILGFTLFWGAVQFVMVPLQVQELAPTDRDAALATVVGVGAVVSMIAAPIAGAVTDRTRSRIGGREPWLIAAALVTAGLAIVASRASSLEMLIVCIAALQVSTNFILTPVSAYLPARVPVAKRGAFSAAYGASQLIGTAVGQITGAHFGDAIPTGYLLAGCTLAVLVVLFALVNRRSNLGEPTKPVSARSLLSTFWVNPLRHPNFAIAFAGRFLFFAGAFAIQTYSIFLLQDYIGLGTGALDAVPLLSLGDLAGVLVGTIVAGIAVQRLRRTRPIIYAAAAIMIIGLSLPLMSPTLPAMIACSALTGLALGIFLSVDLVLITLVLPSVGDAGKDLGIMNITTTLPQTVGAVVGSAIIAATGGYAGLLVLGMVTTAAGAGVLAFIRGVR